MFCEACDDNQIATENFVYADNERSFDIQVCEECYDRLTYKANKLYELESATNFYKFGCIILLIIGALGYIFLF